MTKDFFYKQVTNKIYKENLKISLGNIEDIISLNFTSNNLSVNTSLRWQFNSIITPQAIHFTHHEFEKIFMNLLDNELNKFNSKLTVGFVFGTFYNEHPLKSEEIENEEHLDKYLNEIIKCLKFHDKEVFNKLLNIKFLAEHVSSVPFERKAEIVVGGSFPIQLFKKMAILKWGNQEERYLEYKKGTQMLIEKYAIKKPEKYIPEFQIGYDKLINHLENESNPFEKETSV